MLLVAALAFVPAGAGATSRKPAMFDGKRLTTTMPSLDTLVAQFDRVAFSDEFGGSHRRGHIVKWTKPVRVRIGGEDARSYDDDVRAMLRELRRLSGLSIEMDHWYDAAPSNYEVEFVDRRPAGQAPCVTYVYDDGAVIDRVRIVISTYDVSLRKHCIVEELTQALGLADDSTLIYPSIFHDDSRQQGLYPWDSILLQALYDRRIYPGMSRPAALPVVRRILAELLADMGATTSGKPPAAGSRVPVR